MTLQERLRIKSDMIHMGESIAWGSDSALMDEAANRIDANEALLREAAYALDYAADMTKPTGLQGCDCPICEVSKNIWKRLRKAE